MTTGILALQGDFREHAAMLAQIGAATVLVRLPRHLDQVERLIIPGGESTTIGTLLATYHLIEPIVERVRAGMPLWGTCAGAILMARTISGGRLAGQPQLGVMDITVRRNAYGRQLDSFEAELEVPVLGEPRVPAVFIRAPAIEALGTGVVALARGSKGEVVAARQGTLLATTFHPELTSDQRFHRYFLRL